MLFGYVRVRHLSVPFPLNCSGSWYTPSDHLPNLYDALYYSYPYCQNLARSHFAEPESVLGLQKNMLAAACKIKDQTINAG